MVRVAINGFGRIGRSAFKVAIESHDREVEIVAINDLAPASTLAHLLKFDSNYGVWKHEVSAQDLSTDLKNHPDGEPVGQLKVGDKLIPVYSQKDPATLPWDKLAVDVVIESTGQFTDKEGMESHIKAGAKKVILSAPAKDGDVPTFVIGVNDDNYLGEPILNNASCTTNCIAPIAAVIHKNFQILKATMTTAHAYTADQNLQDGPHRDLRRARSAAVSIVPTSTGAAIATTEAIPELAGLFDGVALRVPVPVGSISDFTFLVSKKTTVEEVNEALTAASKSDRYKGILAVSTDPIVSSDIVGRTESAIADLPLTKVIDGDMVKVFAWYDNELGYSNRLIEQVIKIGNTNNSV